MLKAILGWLLQALGLVINRTPVAVSEGEKVGAAQAVSANAEKALSAETAVAKAEADAPKTQAAIVDRLNTGKF